MTVTKFNRSGQSAGKPSNKELGYYLSGFADGEGSFNVSAINRKKDYKHGWKVSPSFNVSQKDDTIPHIFKNYLGCGKIRYRKDGICYFEVRSFKELSQVVIPFFKEYPLQSKEKKDTFHKFCKIMKIIQKKEHLNKKGLKKILKIRKTIQVGRDRKYSMEEILKSY